MKRKMYLSIVAIVCVLVCIVSTSIAWFTANNSGMDTPFTINTGELTVDLSLYVGFDSDNDGKLDIFDETEVATYLDNVNYYVYEFTSENDNSVTYYQVFQKLDSIAAENDTEYYSIGITKIVPSETYTYLIKANNRSKNDVLATAKLLNVDSFDDENLYFNDQRIVDILAPGNNNMFYFTYVYGEEPPVLGDGETYETDAVQVSVNDVVYLPFQIRLVDSATQQQGVSLSGWELSIDMQQAAA